MSNTAIQEAINNVSDISTTLSSNSNTGNSISSTNCIPGSFLYPYNYGPTYNLQIRQVVNGYIVTVNNQDHVFSTVKELTKFVETTLKVQSKK